MPRRLCFVNYQNGCSDEHSGIAFYDNCDFHNNNLNQQPDAFVCTDLAGDIHWESNEKQPTFSFNVTVVWQIDNDAEGQPANAVAGSADNESQSFTVHKHTSRLLATNADGFQMFTVHYAT